MTRSIHFITLQSHQMPRAVYWAQDCSKKKDQNHKCCKHTAGRHQRSVGPTQLGIFLGKKAEIIAGSQRTMLDYLRTTGVSFLNISTIYLFWGPARSHLMSALWLRWKSICKDLLSVTKAELACGSVHVQWHLGNHPRLPQDVMDTRNTN